MKRIDLADHLRRVAVDDQGRQGRGFRNASTDRCYPGSCRRLAKFPPTANRVDPSCPARIHLRSGEPWASGPRVGPTLVTSSYRAVNQCSNIWTSLSPLPPRPLKLARRDALKHSASFMVHCHGRTTHKKGLHLRAPHTRVSSLTESTLPETGGFGLDGGFGFRAGDIADQRQRHCRHLPYHTQA